MTKCAFAGARPRAGQFVSVRRTPSRCNRPTLDVYARWPAGVTLAGAKTAVRPVATSSAEGARRGGQLGASRGGRGCRSGRRADLCVGHAGCDERVEVGEVLTACSWPTNRKFFRPRATTRNADSLRLLSGGMPGFSMKRVSSGQWLRAYATAEPIGPLGACRCFSASSQS